MNNSSQIIDYVKDATFYLIRLLSFLIRFFISVLFVLSFDRILSAMTPEWLLPWWAVVFILSQFVFMYVMRYYDKKWKLAGMLFLIAVINYWIAFTYNPMPENL